MRDDFEITVPEIDALVEIVDSVLEGEGGVRMTGAGFGGSVVCLCPKDKARPLPTAPHPDILLFTASFPRDCTTGGHPPRAPPSQHAAPRAPRPAISREASRLEQDSHPPAPAPHCQVAAVRAAVEAQYPGRAGGQTASFFVCLPSAGARILRAA